MSETVPPDLDLGFTMKMFVCTLQRRDYAMLEEMLESAREKIPTMTRTDDVCSVIITEFCRQRREKQQAGETPALPGVNPS